MMSEASDILAGMVEHQFQFLRIYKLQKFKKIASELQWKEDFLILLSVCSGCALYLKSPFLQEYIY